jgi:hypothetical protein
MTRFHLPRAGRWALMLIVLALLMGGCAGKRRRYVEQIMVYVEKNDEIDSRVAQLPKVNAYKDPDYLQKLDSYIKGKQVLMTQMESVEPPFLMSTTHNKLLIAMRNGIRYLQSERQKFLTAAKKMATMPKKRGSSQGREEFEIINEYYSQTSAYQADFREEMMKQQYERLYEQAKEELRRAQRI